MALGVPLTGFSKQRARHARSLILGKRPRNSPMASQADEGLVQWTSTSPASETLRRTSAPAGIVLFVGSVFVFGYAAWVFTFAISGVAGIPSYFWVGIGSFLVLLGVYAVVSGRKVRLPALAAVGVSGEGLILRWASGEPTHLRWDDRKLKVELRDMRNYRPTGPGGLVSYLTISGRSGGLTTEACDSILAGARASGIQIKSRPWKGSWGEVGRYTLRSKRTPFESSES